MLSNKDVTENLSWPNKAAGLQFIGFYFSSSLAVKYCMDISSIFLSKLYALLLHWFTITILSILMIYGSGQTVYVPRSGSTLFAILSVFWTHFYMVKPHCSNFRVSSFFRYLWNWFPHGKETKLTMAKNNIPWAVTEDNNHTAQIFDLTEKLIIWEACKLGLPAQINHSKKTLKWQKARFYLIKNKCYT